MNYEKMYGLEVDEGGNVLSKQPAPPEKPKPAELPPIDETLPLIDQAQALTQENLRNLRIIANLASKESDKLRAIELLLAYGHGKPGSDAPRMADKKDKTDVSSKVLALLTDAQLEDLRAQQDG